MKMEQTTKDRLLIVFLIGLILPGFIIGFVVGFIHPGSPWWDIVIATYATIGCITAFTLYLWGHEAAKQSSLFGCICLLFIAIVVIRKIILTH
jgi:hypothetical protein